MKTFLLPEGRPRGALPLFAVGGLELASSLEAKFVAMKINKMEKCKIQGKIWGAYHLYLEQYDQRAGKVWNLKAKFGVHGVLTICGNNYLHGCLT